MSIQSFHNPIYKDITDLLDQTANTSTSCDEIIEILDKSLSDPILKKSIYICTALADNPQQEFLEKIEIIAKLALQSTLFTFKEKLEIYEKTKTLFAAHNLEVNDHHYSIPLLVKDEEGKVVKLYALIQKIASIEFFNKLLLSGFHEANRSDAIGLTLPKPFSYEDFINLLNNKMIPVKNQLISAILLADYLEDRESLSNCINQATKILNSNELCFLIKELPTNEHIATLVKAYIRAMYKERLSWETILLSLSDPSFQDRIKNIYIDLDLSDLRIPDAILMSLPNLFSHVRSLNLSGSNACHLPIAWKEDLLFLDISHTLIASLPHHFTNLATFNAKNAGSFEDVANLDNSTYLKTIDISKTSVMRAPVGCENLEEFKAEEAMHLEDIGGLNGLKSLKAVEVSYTQIINAPLDCSFLERFEAQGAPLDDIRGLDGLLSLSYLDIGSTLVTRAPQGCKNIKEFYARSAQNLTDISGLNDSLSLTNLDISFTTVTRAPSGCKNLEYFEASHANLSDVSELDGLLALKYLDVSNTQILRLPFGCHNLEECLAKRSLNLVDICGLDGLQQLKTLDISHIEHISRAPYGCTNLVNLYAKDSTNLNDISGLDDLKALDVLDVRNTQVTRKPIGCSDKMCFISNDLEELERLSQWIDQLDQYSYS
ncbi:MAG: hypothetical protein FJZ56_01700 [Chlamydiae bacterium]|nr:hypothetical protein [Chlamydiota bacterium]